MTLFLRFSQPKEKITNYGAYLKTKILNEMVTQLFPLLPSKWLDLDKNLNYISVSICNEKGHQYIVSLHFCQRRKT